MHYINTFKEQTFGYLHVNILIIPGLSKKLGLRPKPGRAKPEPPSMARLKVFESPSPQKPGQSRGFQAKPGRAHHYLQGRVKLKRLEILQSLPVCAIITWPVNDI